MSTFTRLLEWIFCLYFFSHIPITLCIDLQVLLPAWLYPECLTDLLKWYIVTFKDPLMLDPPPWFLSFVYCEAFLQLPFFPVASYAFFKGGCKWIRVPAIMYSVHVATTVLAIIVHVLFADFPLSSLTHNERLTLVSIYAPYLLIPLLLLNTMLYNRKYVSEEKQKKK
ncbi:sigma intracellular receptor 2 [Ambystoma mexicanum]|uniref:sigma intracellular receptor 2 n=1 Tax=Ambystoma mexicanum TaxID=8296 RepID=UPI0037E89803